jgi:hypothetical protein
MSSYLKKERGNISLSVLSTSVFTGAWDILRLVPTGAEDSSEFVEETVSGSL